MPARQELHAWIIAFRQVFFRRLPQAHERQEIYRSSLPQKRLEPIMLRILLKNNICKYGE